MKNGTPVCSRPRATTNTIEERSFDGFAQLPQSLPLRSTVGQPPLERHIGVRIPEGQPNSSYQTVAYYPLNPPIFSFALGFLRRVSCPRVRQRHFDNGGC